MRYQTDNFVDKVIVLIMPFLYLSLSLNRSSSIEAPSNIGTSPRL